MAKLLVTHPGNGDLTHELAGDVITIGRTPDNKVQISHDTISSHHAQLVRSNGHFRLKNLSSTNASCVNGQPVTEAILTGSCILRFGAIECVFKDDQVAATPDQLTTHLSDSRRQIEALMRARDALHEQNRELARQRDCAQTGRDDLQDEVEASRSQIDYLKQELAKAAAEKQAADGNVEAIRAEEESAASLRQELAEATAGAEAVEKRAASLREAELEDELRSARESLIAANEACDAAERERASLAQRFSETEDRLKGAHDQEATHAKISAENVGLRRQLEDAQTEQENFSKRMDNLTSELEKVSAERETLQEKFAAELSKTQAELAASVQQRDAAERQCTELLAQIVDAQRQAEILTGELDATRRHDEELVQQLAQARRELQQNEHRFGTKIAELERQLAAMSEEQEALAREKLTFSALIEAQGTELGALKNAQRASAGLSSRAAEAERRLRELSESSHAAQAQHQELSGQLESARSQVRELTKQRDALLETHARLAAEVEASRAGAEASDRKATAAAYVEQRAFAQRAEPDAGQAVHAPPELASWLKRAFHRRKEPLPAVPVAEPTPRVVTGPRFPITPPADLEDTHAVSLDFLGSPDPAPGASAPDLVMPVPPAPEPPAAELAPAPLALVAAPAEAPVKTAPLSLQMPAEVPLLPPDPAVLQPIPQTIAAMRRTLQYFIRHTADVDMLQELWQRSSEISAVTAASGYPLLHTATSAFESMMKDLYTAPSRVSAPALRTVGQSIDFILALVEHPQLERLASQRELQALAIEDEPDVLEGIVAALETVKLKACATRQARPALALLSSQRFDLILLDVGLPDMNGIELCAKVRGMAQHRRTPIVFLTGMTTVEHRAQTTLNGGNDFIAKPFHLSELSMKAATWVIKGHMGMV